MSRPENLHMLRQAHDGTNPDSRSVHLFVSMTTWLFVVLVCVSEVDHVVMFDCPLNLSDYSHQSLRTGWGVEEDCKGNDSIRDVDDPV